VTTGRPSAAGHELGRVAARRGGPIRARLWQERHQMGCRDSATADREILPGEARGGDGVPVPPGAGGAILVKVVRVLQLLRPAQGLLADLYPDCPDELLV